jgi:[ribosomal protein S5]-alanine N-acetyltransferase
MTLPNEPIVIVTQRLTLRYLGEADLPEFYNIFSHPEVMRYWSSPAWTDMAQAEQALARIMAGYQSGNDYQLGIERQADHALVGTCTIFHFHLPSRRAEIGYALGRPYWGKGYMHEALQGLIRYAFTTLDLNRLEADIDPRNAASARILERLGFQREGFLRERWIVGGEISDTWLYGLLRREWAASPPGLGQV